MQIFNIKIVLIPLFFFYGCSYSTPINPDKNKPTFISQDSIQYTKSLDENLTLSFDNYKKKYFSPWHLEKSTIGIEEAGWAFKYNKVANNYGANLQPIEKDFFTKMREEVNFKEFGTLNRYAISLKELNIRALPTSKPLFKDPKKAGEGYPFDYLQNSTLHRFKPIFVTHYSKNREWVHVETSFTYGWIKREDIRFVSKNEIEYIESKPQAVVQKENVDFYDDKNRFLGRTKLGMLFSIVGESERKYRVAVLDEKKNDFITTEIDKNVLHNGSLVFNKKNIDKILNIVLKNQYGWGGLNGERDCSSTIRDFYAPFALWLPRNSSQQAKYGEVHSLKGMSDREKLDFIKRYAIPFRTLIYKRGHILLYIGVEDFKVIVFQNMWGIKTKVDNKEGRYIIGKALFSTLDFGSDLDSYDNDSKMISKLRSINTLF
jgi:hypothetical protein